MSPNALAFDKGDCPPELMRHMSARAVQRLSTQKSLRRGGGLIEIHGWKAQASGWKAVCRRWNWVSTGLTSSLAGSLSTNMRLSRCEMRS